MVSKASRAPLFGIHAYKVESAPLTQSVSWAISVHGINIILTVLLATVLLTTTRLVAAQVAGPGIEFLTSQQITVDDPMHPHVESFIAVDPRDPRHLLATSMVMIDGGMRSYPYASFDGGKSWTPGRMTDEAGVVTGDDPLVYFSYSGGAFFSCLATVNGLERTVIARSTDGGRTWRWSAILPSADRPWMVFAPTRGPFGGRAYFTGTGVYRSRDGARATGPFLARSDDDGQTFPMRSIVAYDRGGTDAQAPINAVPLEPIVAPDGQLLLTLQGSDLATLERLSRDSLTARTIGIITSDDGGESFGPARYAPTQHVTITGGGVGRHRATAAFGNIRSAVDSSASRYRNRVYFVAPDYDRSIDRYVVRVWYTSDFGKTWRDVVASDAAHGDVANPAIAVNRDGVVAVTWNDRRDDPDGKCWRLYAAISTDGGEHFRPAQRLSQQPTCTNDPRNWDTFGTAFNSEQRGQYLAHVQTGASVPTRFPNGGDTQGLAADGAGVFHAAWITGESGVMQLWHTSFQVEPGLVSQLRSQTVTAATYTAHIEPPPAGMEDVTHDVVFKVTSTKLDFPAHAYSITLQIENQSGRPIYGPLRAVMYHFLDPVDNGLGLKNLSVANADSGGPGVGATWTFEVQGGVLAPGAHSAPRVVRLTFEGGVPSVPEGYLTAGFRVYAPAQLERRRGSGSGDTR
jgi:hypothetical protein